MRTATVKIGGKEFEACVSTALLIKLEERTGKSGTEAMKEMLTGENIRIADVFWLINEMLQAGFRYQKLQGEDPAQPPALEDLQDLVGVDEYKQLFAGINAAVRSGTTPEVTVEPSKNPKNAQASPDE